MISKKTFIKVTSKKACSKVKVLSRGTQIRFGRVIGVRAYKMARATSLLHLENVKKENGRMGCLSNGFPTGMGVL